MSILTSEIEHGRASSPVFQFCRPPKQDNLLSLRHSVDCSYLLKIPNSRSSNASLSSVLEDREYLDKLKLTNGFKSCATDKSQCTVAEIKLPSYVSISCAINGYPGYSRFCRSRDNSPARSSLRKSSLEPSMLADSTKDSYESHRYSRSQSDCNGTMHTTQTVFTESKRVTVSKQIQVPLKSSFKYTTEVSLSNGHSSERRTVVREELNGHELAKEVGECGTKSLVQQRIESLYGRDDVQVSRREAPLNGDCIASRSPTPNGKNHIGSVSPPVFRHLNKDFRKQLQINIPKKCNSDATKISKALKKDGNPEVLSKKENGFSPIPNGMGHDECDRIKSMTPPPLKSQSTIPDKLSARPGDGEGYRFLSLIDLEKEKIQAEVKLLEEELAAHSASIPEEALGRIRAACGKANLLITQKFEQFRGLCWKHIEENPSVPFYTTASDLAGFWDLVMLQVDDINSTFREIDAMKKNNWKEVVCEKPVMPIAKIRHSNPNAVSRSNPTTPKRSAKSAELTKAREEARRQLLAAKKKGRQQAASQDEIAIFAPTTTAS